ncbi:hypothetical protein BDZ89DRAFT_977112 [Hymenopellis radicata]|nr:hypothetical protein BDZ89DRAFT_977112 [Hymenopellis radicata]
MNRASCLCPGYTHVDAFDPQDEYEEEEEEVSYVVLDLENVDPSLIPSSSTYRLIGLDTPTPFIQLSGTVLKGVHDSMLGTELIFTEDKESADRVRKPINYLAGSGQRVSFREVRLQRKEDDPEGQEVPETELVLADDRHALDRTTGNAAPPPRKRRKSKKQMDEDEDDDDDEAEGAVPPRRRSRKQVQVDESEDGVSKKKRGRPRRGVSAVADAAPDKDVTESNAGDVLDGERVGLCPICDRYQPSEVHLLQATDLCVFSHTSL